MTISAELVREVERLLLEGGRTHRQIGDVVGISKSSVTSIARGEMNDREAMRGGWRERKARSRAELFGPTNFNRVRAQARAYRQSIQRVVEFRDNLYTSLRFRGSGILWVERGLAREVE
jgi:hypothetical protein